MDAVYLSFVWHMHQPYYKNLYTGEYLMPWVLLHGTKDYFDMPYMLKEFPGLKQNYNLVPSLLIQLADYENPGVQDSYLNVFRKEPQDLADGEKIFILLNFFNANWDNMIKPFPRYFELLKKRGLYIQEEDLVNIKDYFNDEDYRDLQILFFLAWIDPIFYEIHEDLKGLREKGRRFTEEDKGIVEDIQRHILKGIVPLYKELSHAGTIELSTSPFYHPIIPLIIDNGVMKESMPDRNLPARPFSRPEDATAQIVKALELFSHVFQFTPSGMWPPEGSVSNDALRLYMEQGVQWLATDEEILFRSLNVGWRRDGGHLPNPEILYKPYRYERDGREISLVFRDKTLSDLISFHYARSEPGDAAADLISRIKGIGRSVSGRIKKPLVTIVMDGENAWESYRNDGRDFFKYLYEGILADKQIVPTTVSEFLDDVKEVGNLHHCFAGSWIAHNFSIWIGHEEDNMSWSLLSETRDALEAMDPEKQNKKAWESMYIAEGSDWNWWYGDENSSDNDEIFDLLFRENLSNVYRFLGKEPPENLSMPIITEHREIRPTWEPVNLIRPVIDGRITSYFEWMGAGFLEGKGIGTAMHEAASLLKGCHYGFDGEHFYLRVDIDRTYIHTMEDVTLTVDILGTQAHTLVCRLKDGAFTDDLPAKVGLLEIFEMKTPLSDIKAKAGESLRLWVSLKINETLSGRIPAKGVLLISVPSENFEMEMWRV